MERKLEFVATFKDAIALGMNNAIPLLLTVVIYVLTIWIPYINIGTSIAMATLPGKLAHGETISPFFIFDSVYRRQIGNFLLFCGLYIIMLIPAILFLNVVLPVLLIMYSLSLFILIDRETTPIEALEMSRKATYGFKWKIFFILFIYELVLYIIPQIIIWPLIGIGALITYLSDDSSSSTFLTIIAYGIGIIFSIVGICCGYAINAIIYRELFLKAQGQPEEPASPKEFERVFKQEIEATPINKINNDSSDTVDDSTIPNEE